MMLVFFKTRKEAEKGIVEIKLKELELIVDKFNKENNSIKKINENSKIKYKLALVEVEECNKH